MHNLKMYMGVVVGSTLISILAFTLACGGTTAPPSAPAPYVAPTAVPAATIAPLATSTPRPIRAAVSSGPKSGGTMRFVLAAGMKDLDPRHYVAYREKHVQFNVYEGLVANDPGMNIIPALAKSWEIAGDGKTLTFELREGVQFHDGTKFTADAIKSNMSYILNKDNISTSRSGIEPAIDEVDVIDTYTVALKLKKPWRPLLATLVLTDQLVPSPEWSEHKAHPVGTGPFEFVEWRVGNKLTLTRNKNYWDDSLPYLDKIIFAFVPDVTVQLAMLRTGEAELITEVPGTDLPLINKNPNLTISQFESYNWYNLYMKITKPPYDNKALREAIWYALDKERLVQVQLGGHGRPAWNTWGFSWWGDSSFEPHKYDPKKAKEKLVEAGYPDGLTTPYWCMANDRELRECEIIQAIVGEVGINLEIKPVITEDYRKFRGGECRFCKMGYFLRGDPDPSHRFLLHSKGTAARTRVEYSNPEVDRLIDEAAGVYDLAKAGQIYNKVQQIAFEEAFYSGTFFPVAYAAMGENVNKFEWWMDNYVRFKEMWIDPN